jgi:hypothetical protein
MEQIVDLITNDSSASDISDAIKDALFAKTAEKIDSLRPQIANSFFNPPQVDED